MPQSTTAATPKKRASAKRKPAAKTRTAASKTTARSTSTRSATNIARAQQLTERAVLIPVGFVRETRDRVAGLVTAGKDLDLNVENLTTRVEKVVQNGVDAGIKLVNGVQ